MRRSEATNGGGAASGTPRSRPIIRHRLNRVLDRPRNSRLADESAPYLQAAGAATASRKCFKLSTDQFFIERLCDVVGPSDSFFTLLALLFTEFRHCKKHIPSVCSCKYTVRLLAIIRVDPAAILQQRVRDERRNY
jgi:hypothetical protein